MTFTLPNASPQAGDVNQLRMIAQGIRELAKGNLVFQGYLEFVPAFITANTNLGAEALLFFNTNGGNITATLPPVATSSGLMYFAKKADASGNHITFSGDANIDGAATKVLSTAWQNSILACDGTQWLTFG